MRAKLSFVFATVLVCVFSTAAQSVIESESSLIITNSTAEIELTVTSPSLNASHVRLELIDPENTVRAELAQDVKLAAGKRKYKFSLQIGDLMRTASDQIAWYRLRYTVGNTSGIASLSQLMRDDFDLRASAFEHIVPGQTMRVRVRSLNPFTEEAVKGVEVKINLKIDLNTEAEEDRLSLSGAAKTGGNGFAYVDFKIPDNVKPDGGEINITGQKHGVVRKIEEDLDNDDQYGTVVLTTDKPLYQPGQTFNIRGLYFDANNTVVPDSDLKFTIQDENETVVYRQTVQTSGYGIASIVWQIPENARLGGYTVEVEADDDLRENRLYFKVSRYDLPNFSVKATPDKSYYLPTDSRAHIAVTADYLFGKPVTQGKIRVVQENDRRWDYSSQRYVSKEGAVVEGQADAQGKYTADVDLSGQFLEMQSREWERYRDVSFSAYYTDLTTNRTEQRRFDIRITKEPIHVYLIRYANQHQQLPLVAYVSTFYADGTPAICDVEVRDKRQTVDRFRSNTLGAGKMEIRVPNERFDRDRYELSIVARDKKGQTGTMEESFYLDNDEDAIQISTDKTIYKPGDMVEIDLASTKEAGYVYLDVIKDWSPLASSVVMLHGGKAHMSIPYQPTFKGELSIAAYSDKETGRWSDSMRAARGIIFPEQQNLVLNAKFSKNEFRPAEDATIRFSVLDSSRRPVESAIGLGIFDKAIEERARTETEFGSYFNRFDRYLGYDRSFGNISLKDLNDLDMSRPVSPEMQLAAEVMLAPGWYYPTIFHSGNLDTAAETLYKDAVHKELEPLGNALNTQYKKDFDHPTDAASLERILRSNEIDISTVLDPWGEPYVPSFSVNRTQDIVELKTAGPDKKAGTLDDFTAYSAAFNYFTKTGEAVDRAVLEYRNRIGKFIRDLGSLTTETARQGVDISTIKDRWGRDYIVYFEVVGRNYTIRFHSVGPNGYLELEPRNSDDVDVWTSNIDYFGDSEKEINRVLDQEVNFKKRPFPRNEQEFGEMLRKNGINIDDIKDGYGRTVYVAGKLETQFVNKTVIENEKTIVRPVSQEMMSFKIRSMGQDAVISGDDSDLAAFSGAITEAYKGTGFAKADARTVVYSGAKGAISGTITDPNGAVIPNATIRAIDENDSSNEYTTATDTDGKFLLGNLPSGNYSIQVNSSGFTAYRSQHIEVRSRSMVEVNIVLSPGAASATVDVVASSSEVNNSTNASVASTVTEKGAQIKFPYKDQSSTPRLREYFPESLAWQPELVTDKKGRAEMNFKMADNITTWKMFAIASTKKGKVGVVEKEITAFQSFFVDLDPPKFLTLGDEIYLPTQVRNYTERPQKVDVTMDKADWFTFLGGAKQQVTVNSGSSENATFGFKAFSIADAGKQRVTAVGQTDSDAIERPVTVRPDGEEIVRTDSRYFTGSTRMQLDFPSNALDRTQKAELKIYPNLFSHVSESVEGLLHRPYGCGEQTISSTYPNLMILKFVKKDSALKQKAQRYLQKGYERLLGYQVAGGGFTYWGGKDTPDISLTAYALRFLSDASEFIVVDEDVVKKAQAWLTAQQKPDGSWLQRSRWENQDDPNPMRSKMTTTYVVRTLAMLERATTAAERDTSPAHTALTTGLGYLKQRNAEIDEPYALALFGLASLDAGDKETATTVAGQLEKMAVPEGSAVYWKLETNTPFYGWGTAGRIETTALAVQLLTKVAKSESKPTPDAASKGLLFLLKNKDRYGVWYSTQTTINVLDSFLATLADGNLLPQNLQVIVNGIALPDISVAADRIEPVSIDLTGKLSPTSNSIEVRGDSNASLMSQMVATHYIDWRDSTSTNMDVGPSRALKLDYKCDKPNPAVMEEVTCTVNAERIAFRGYGMLLAEIGTPPGADVSRESLEAAIQNDWSISRYDILPDRIVLYMWSKPGGSKFNFKFRPRYRINAQTPASIVYDYYNPEAHATVAPLRFSTK